MPARWLKGLIVGATIGASGIALALSPFYQSLETRLGLYSLFHVRGVKPPPAEVAVVAIDGRTGEKLGLPDLPRDWPRSVHGKLVRELVKRGAAAIVFDMDFRRPKDPKEEQDFAEAVATASRVVLFEHLNGRLQPIEDSTGLHRGAVWVEEMEPPLPLLANAARALGPFPLPKVDAAVDQFWTFKSSAHDAPTMPAAALQIYALRYYDRWRQQLTTAVAAPLDWLPESAADIRDAEQMRRFMLDQRRLFELQPEVAKKIAVNEDEPAEETGSARVLNAILGLYSGESGRFLNYYGPPGSILTLPYHAVIQGGDPNVSPAALNLTNKVVFVGYSDLYDPGQPDRFYTVFTRADGVDLSGVEIAATAFANLLTQDSVAPLGVGTTLLVLLSFDAAVGALVYLAPAVVGVVGALCIAVIYVIAAQWSFNHSATWWPVVTPVLIQLPLALFIGLMAQYRLERRRAEHISEAIRYYVPEEVSRALIAPGIEPSSVNTVTYGTCLATDMAGFSTIAEKMGPGDLARFLNEYFEALAQALQRHGVKVTEFRADAIMCAWTGSADDPSVRQLPVAAALDAAQAISFFNQQRDLTGSLRVGLADGQFYVGHAGGGGHFVYSIVGDCANTASRIEGLNKHLGTQILATRTVVADQGDLLTRFLGDFRFVGKTGSLPIAEILAERSAATARQVELHDRFVAAQAAFQSGLWRDAAAEFERLLKDFPQDGPTRFLLGRCHSYLETGNQPEEPGVIIMATK